MSFIKTDLSKPFVIWMECWNRDHCIVTNKIDGNLRGCLLTYSKQSVFWLRWLLPSVSRVLRINIAQVRKRVCLTFRLWLFKRMRERCELSSANCMEAISSLTSALRTGCAVNAAVFTRSKGKANNMTQRGGRSLRQRIRSLRQEYYFPVPKVTIQWYPARTLGEWVFLKGDWQMV